MYALGRGTHRDGVDCFRAGERAERLVAAFGCSRGYCLDVPYTYAAQASIKDPNGFKAGQLLAAAFYTDPFLSLSPPISCTS